MGSPLIAQAGGHEQPVADPLTKPRTQPQSQQPEHPDFESFEVTKDFAVTKLVLGSLNLLIAIVTVGLVVGAITSPYGYGDTFHVISPCLGLAIASILWQTAEHVTLAFRRDWRAIHPGAHVGVHMMLCIFAIWVVTMSCLKLVFEQQHWGTKWDCEVNFDIECTFPSLGAALWYFSIIKALIGLGVMLLILHLTLFLMACIETDRRRRYERITKVIYSMTRLGPTHRPMKYTLSDQPPQDGIGSVLGPQISHMQQR